MNRNFIIIAFMVCALALAAGCKSDNATAANPAKPIIAVVDAEKVFQQSKLAAAGMEYIQQQGEALNNRLTAMQEEIATKPEDAELAGKMQEELAKIQAEYDAAQRNTAEKINALFDKVIADYVKEAGFEVVLPAQVVMGGRDGLDITAIVVERMDKETINFTAE